MKRVLILGGGFGGLAAAHRLKQLLPEKDESLLIDQRADFMKGFLTEPGPQIELTDPSPIYLEEKRAFKKDRLQAWFG